MRTRQIKDFEDYLISDSGVVIKSSSGRAMSQHVCNHGYPYVFLTKQKKRYIKKVHRLLMEAFVPNPENKATVNHINGIKTDNRLSNLEWATVAENVRHAYANNLGKPPKGEHHCCAILTEDAVRDIRKYKHTHKHYSLKYGVTEGAILRVIHRKTWKHI